MDELELFKLQARCVSHEIRNCMSVCEMYSEIAKKYLARDGYCNTSVLNALDCIQNSLKIIGNSLIDLKSVNSPTPQIFDVKDLLHTALEVSKAYLINKNISLDVVISTESTVYADEHKFIACIINLIKNASEAISDSGIISVNTDIDGEFVKIYIENSGAKIPDDKQKTIFDAGVTTKSYGNGLGLFICKNNLNMFNADLRLLKSDEKSTIFEVIVPKAEIK